MKKNEEKLERLLKAELEKEAEKELAAVEADESLREVSPPEEMDDVLRSMIRDYDAEQEAYAKLSKKDQEALRLGREIQILRESDAAAGEDEDEHTRESARENTEDVGEKADMAAKSEKVVRYRKKRNWKIYALVAVVAALVLGMGMTSIGGAPFLTDMWKNIVGDREVVRVSTEREDGKPIEKDDDKEALIYEQIKSELGVEIVGLEYMPEGVEVLTCDIDNKLNRVCILFQCQEEIIEYQVVLNFNGQTYGYDVEDEIVDKRSVEVSGVPIEITQYKLPSGKKEYAAQFNYKDAFYTLNAAIPEEEFVKIIDNLFFY